MLFSESQTAAASLHTDQFAVKKKSLFHIHVVLLIFLCVQRWNGSKHQEKTDISSSWTQRIWIKWIVLTLDRLFNPVSDDGSLSPDGGRRSDAPGEITAHSVFTPSGPPYTMTAQSNQIKSEQTLSCPGLSNEASSCEETKSCSFLPVWGAFLHSAHKPSEVDGFARSLKTRRAENPPFGLMCFSVNRNVSD